MRVELGHGTQLSSVRVLSVEQQESTHMRARTQTCARAHTHSHMPHACQHARTQICRMYIHMCIYINVCVSVCVFVCLSLMCVCVCLSLSLCMCVFLSPMNQTLFGEACYKARFVV